MSITPTLFYLPLLVLLVPSGLTLSIQCPSVESVAPCLCTDSVDTPEVICDGPTIDEPIIANLFTNLRLINNLTSTDDLSLSKFTLSNTNMSRLGLEPLHRSIITDLTFVNNSDLFYVGYEEETPIRVEKLEILNNPKSFSTTYLFRSISSSLKVLIIQGHLLRRVDSASDLSLDPLTNLEFIDLQFNRIRSINGDGADYLDLAKLKKLKHLNLSNNQLKRLGANAFRLTSLAYDDIDVELAINLDDNQLTDGNIDADFGIAESDRVVKLSLRNNNFAYLSDDKFETFLLANMKNTLDGTGNPWACQRSKMLWLKEIWSILNDRVSGIECDF